MTHTRIMFDFLRIISVVSDVFRGLSWFPESDSIANAAAISDNMYIQ